MLDIVPGTDETYELEGSTVDISTVGASDLQAIAASQVRLVGVTRDLIEKGITPKDGYFLWSAGETVEEAEQVMSRTVDMERSLMITHTVEDVRQLVGYLLVLPYDKVVEAGYCSEEYKESAVTAYKEATGNRRAKDRDLVCGQIYLKGSLRGRSIKDIQEVSNNSAGNFSQKGVLTAVGDDGSTSQRIATHLYTTHGYLNRKYPATQGEPATAWLASVAQNNGRSNTFHLKHGGFSTIQHLQIKGEASKILYQRPLSQG